MNHRSSQSGITIIAVLGWLVVSAVAAVLIAPKATNRVVSAALNKPVAAVESAKVEVKKAEVVVDTKKEDTIHNAAIEVDKAGKAAAELPPSPAADLTKRFIGNAHAGLNEVSPLTFNEDRNNTAILIGLLAEETAKRQAAEKGLQVSQADLAVATAAKTAAEALQKAAEDKQAQTSTQLTEAKTAKEAVDKTLAVAQDKLEASHVEIAGKLTEIETHKARIITLGILAVILAGIAWYFKRALNGTGVSLHSLEATLNPAVFHQVVGTMDAALEKTGPLVAHIGQWAIREGKAAGAALASKTKSVEAGIATLAKAQVSSSIPDNSTLPSLSPTQPTGSGSPA